MKNWDLKGGYEMLKNRNAVRNIGFEKRPIDSDWKRRQI